VSSHAHFTARSALLSPHHPEVLAHSRLLCASFKDDGPTREANPGRILQGSGAGKGVRPSHLRDDGCRVPFISIFDDWTLRGLAEAVVERIAGAAHGADRVGLMAAVERLAQAADVDVDGALVDVDVGAPHAVEQLLA
jgi:hypothetical protein